MKPFILECDVNLFRALGVKIERIGGCKVANTGAQNAVLNCVYLIENDSAVEVTAQRVIDNFNAQGLPHSWWVETQSESPKLTKVLKTNGKQLLGEFVGLAIDLAGYPESATASDLTIATVS